MNPPTVNKKTAATPTPNNRRSSIESDQSSSTKKKSSRACAPCRKRKVKCNGQKPCDRCAKTESVCEYDKPQKKKDTPKPTISDNNHEPRLKALEQFLKHFSRLLDSRQDPEPPLFSNPNTPSSSSSFQGPSLQYQQQNRLSVTTTGQGLYVPDKYLRIDRVPDPYKPSMSDWNPIVQEVFPVSTTAESFFIRENLLNIYFQFVDPVIPILHKASFLQQLRHQRQGQGSGGTEPISHLLLNAIYCVSSRWDLAVPSIGEEPRGWAYYQNAVNLLDQQQEPKLSTVQALFLLLKYNEHVRRPGFIWRTRYYFQMIVRLCKDLGLSRDIICTSTNVIVEIEKRKRTFWAVYCYDVMMSIENGTMPNFSLKEGSLDIPHVLADEAQEHEKIMHFILLTKIIRNQADIVTFLKSRASTTTPTTSLLFEAEEKRTTATKTFEQLTDELKTTIGLVTSTTKFPQKETMCYTICFLYLACCFATILLHRPFALFHQSQTIHTLSHQSHCTEAAINIKIITELILECNAFEDMYCSIRGIQQIVHYLSAAVTIFKEGKYVEDLKQTMQLLKRLASISPATEVIGGISLLEGGGVLPQQQRQAPILQQQAAILQQPQPAPPQSSSSTPIHSTTGGRNMQQNRKRVEKRKSLHQISDTAKSQQQHQEGIVKVLSLGSPSASSSFHHHYRNSMIYSQQPQLQQPFNFQQQQNTNYYYNARSTSNMSIDNDTAAVVDLPSIPNHESLLGLLFEDDPTGCNTRNNNIP